MNVHRLLALSAAVCFSIAPLSSGAAPTQGADKPSGGCGGGDTYGTAIHWVRTAVEAKKLAREQEKLIFVVHVSGNFTRDAFT